MEIIVRPAVKADMEAMVVLLEQLFAIEKDFTPDALCQRKGLALLLAGQTSVILVAQVEEKVVGMASMQCLISTAQGGPAGLVEDVVVDGEWRGQGLGRRLLQALEDHARSVGLTRLQLLADRQNQPALDFYEKQAWTLTQLTGLRKIL